MNSQGKVREFCFKFSVATLYLLWKLFILKIMVSKENIDQINTTGHELITSGSLESLLPR